MSGTLPEPDRLGRLRREMEVCDRFEAAWPGNPRLRIEDELDRILRAGESVDVQPPDQLRDETAPKPGRDARSSGLSLAVLRVFGGDQRRLRGWDLPIRRR